MNSEQLRQGLVTPPTGYGCVPFYWWMGDKLDKERILWQLDQLEGHGISGLQINYAHSDEGGLGCGLTYQSDPDLFTEEWWKLVGWFLEECKKRGMSISLSDYTLGKPGQGKYTDDILRRHPEITGQKLEYVPDDQGGMQVVVTTVEHSYNPIHPLAGRELVDTFFGEFERRFPGESGRGLNFFFSDELEFNISGNLWCDDFAEEFRRRKGYAIGPHLEEIFTDTGENPYKTRLDYYDVIVQLEAERYFGPLFDWHESHGMIYGCDHGGRGCILTEFGDYFRTVCFNQGPGCDQPCLESHVVKNKVASSIAHLYQRPRVWLEGFHSSGWATNTAQLTDALVRNYTGGQNLLSLHGLYYSTKGGWWEWAPPCNGWRMPYWEDMRTLMKAVERASFVMSQGVHRCDVAIVYPVAAMEGGDEGGDAAYAAFSAAEALFNAGRDLDFIDFSSLDRAEIRDDRLCVAGEEYPVLIIPDMHTIRMSTMEKALRFLEAGGIVIHIGELPRHSDGDLTSVLPRYRELATFAQDAQEALALVSRLVPPDVEPEGVDSFWVNHRIAGDTQLYMLCGIPQGTRCRFRAKGQASLWNLWDGRRYVLPQQEDENGTRVRLPARPDDFQIIAFDSEQGELPIGQLYPVTSREMPLDGDWDFTLEPCLDNRYGDYFLPATDEKLGAMARKFRYTAQGKEREEAVFSYGTYFLKAGPFAGEDALQAAVNDALRGCNDGFAPHTFSLRYGLYSDPGHQGYHGLKGIVHDDFLTCGVPVTQHTCTTYEPYQEGFGAVYVTNVYSDREDSAYVLMGEFRPDALYLNGKPVESPRVPVHKGYNRLVAVYRRCGAGYVALSWKDTSVPQQELASSWYCNADLLPFDPYAGECRDERLSFLSPPALEALELRTPCGVEVWIGEEKAALTAQDGRITARVNHPNPKPVEVTIRVTESRGRYGGAVLDEPVKLRCGTGKLPAMDTSTIDSLRQYSGGMRYARTVEFTEEMLASPVLLDLGHVVSSARVYVNGTLAGIKAAPDWTFRLDGLAGPGANRIDVVVHNTLANHYDTIPTKYKGDLTSGLLGPVRLLYGA